MVTSPHAPKLRLDPLNLKKTRGLVAESADPLKAKSGLACGDR
jgi:hypothetical protein